MFLVMFHMGNYFKFFESYFGRYDQGILESFVGFMEKIIKLVLPTSGCLFTCQFFKRDMLQKEPKNKILLLIFLIFYYYYNYYSYY